MNGIVDSPFFKAFATTNSLLLGAGALYLVSFGRESSLKHTDQSDHEQSSCRKQSCLNNKQTYTESQG